MQERGRIWAVRICAGLLLLALLAGCTENSESEPLGAGADSGGEALYVQHCAACHGVQGEGQPNWRLPDANGVYPAPPHDSTGHTWHHPDDLLLQIIAQGGSRPTSYMPGFAEQLTPAEMEAVLEYVKTFWGAQERSFQEQV